MRDREQLFFRGGEQLRTRSDENTTGLLHISETGYRLEMLVAVASHNKCTHLFLGAR